MVKRERNTETENCDFCEKEISKQNVYAHKKVCARKQVGNGYRRMFYCLECGKFMKKGDVKDHECEDDVVNTEKYLENPLSQKAIIELANKMR